MFPIMVSYEFTLCISIARFVTLERVFSFSEFEYE